MNDFRKSISAIMHDRLSSPLFGAFFFSWIVINWKIIFVIFLTTSEELGVPKFIYIENELLNILDSLVYPLISTAFILTLYSWLSVEVYRLYLTFKTKKLNYKTTSESKELLDTKRASQLRLEIARQQTEVENILIKKDDEIEKQKQINQETSKKYEEEIVKLSNEIKKKDEDHKNQILKLESAKNDVTEVEYEEVSPQKKEIHFKLFTLSGNPTKRLKDAFNSNEVDSLQQRKYWINILTQLMSDEMLEQAYSIILDVKYDKELESTEEVAYMVEHKFIEPIKHYEFSFDLSDKGDQLFKILNKVKD